MNRQEKLVKNEEKAKRVKLAAEKKKLFLAGEKRKRVSFEEEKSGRSSSPTQKKKKLSLVEEKPAFSKSGSEEKPSSSNAGKILIHAINQTARLDGIKPLIKTKQLDMDHLYQIDELKMVSSEYGPAAMASLDNKWWIFLPKRLALSFMEHPDELETMKKLVGDSKITLRYLGGKYNRCEFNVEAHDISSSPSSSPSSSQSYDSD